MLTFFTLSYTLGQWTGIIGFVLFTLTLLLAIRLPVLEKVFGDLSHAYKIHQTLGAVTLILLSWHPLLLALPYLVIDKGAAAGFIFQVADVPRFVGLLGLMLLEIALVFTYFVRIPYHIWKNIHKFLGLAFLLGGLHALFINGVIAFTPWMRGMILVFLLMGLGVIVFRVIGHRFLVRRLPYRIEEVTTLGEKGEFTRVSLMPIKQVMKFKAGQFAYITPEMNGMREEHPFSICSPEGDEKLVFTIKNLGDFTAKLPELTVGSTVSVEGPFGKFSYLQGGKKQIWVAGGIGITPFISLAQSLPTGYNVTLFYSVRNKAEAIGLEELTKVAEKNPGLQIMLWESDERGYLTSEVVKDNCSNITDLDVFICGPKKMMENIRNGLFACGMDFEHVHTEAFSLLPSELS